MLYKASKKLELIPQSSRSSSSTAPSSYRSHNQHSITNSSGYSSAVDEDEKQHDGHSMEMTPKGHSARSTSDNHFTAQQSGPPASARGQSHGRNSVFEALMSGVRKSTDALRAPHKPHLVAQLLYRLAIITVAAAVTALAGFRAARLGISVVLGEFLVHSL